MNDPERLEIYESFYNELQTALVPRAMELREREAKILGVPVENIPLQISSQKDDTFKVKDKREQAMTFEKNMASKIDNNELIENISNLNLASLLAMTVSQKSKDLGLCAYVEQFGDVNDDEDDDDCVDDLDGEHNDNNDENVKITKE